DSREADPRRHRPEDAGGDPRRVLREVARPSGEPAPPPAHATDVQVPGDESVLRHGGGQMPPECLGVHPDSRATRVDGGTGVQHDAHDQSTSTTLWSPTTSRWALRPTA